MHSRSSVIPVLDYPNFLMNRSDVAVIMSKEKIIHAWTSWRSCLCNLCFVHHCVIFCTYSCYVLYITVSSHIKWQNYFFHLSKLVTYSNICFKPTSQGVRITNDTLLNIIKHQYPLLELDYLGLFLHVESGYGLCVEDAEALFLTSIFEKAHIFLKT